MNAIKKREQLAAYLFLIPGAIIIGVFVLWPILYSIPLAFTNYSVIGDTEFVGFKNFMRAFEDPNFRVALINSLKYLIVVPIIQVISLLLAVLMNSKIRGIKFFRTAYYIPVITSMVAVSIVWGALYDVNGVINGILQTLHITDESIDFLNDKDTALYSVMAVTIWKGLGYYMMIYLAGLQGISNDVMEAAKIDGTSRFRTLTKITIPLMSPYIAVCSLLSMMAAIRVFDEIFVLTNGGPGNATYTSSFIIYQQGFVSFEYGYASAMGLIVSLIIISISLISYIVNKKVSK